MSDNSWLIPREVFRASDNLHRLIFRSLQADLLSSFTFSKGLEGFSIASNDALEQASPFFWRHLYSLSNEQSMESSTGSALRNHAALLFFDSFFDFLPDGVRLELYGLGTDEVVLPTLGVALRPSANRLCLGRRAEAILVEDGLGERLVRRGESALHEDLSLSRSATIRVLGSSIDLLFEREYTSEIDASADIAVFARHVEGALSLLRSTPHDLASEAVRIAKWFVPIKSPHPGVHRSFSSAQLKGVVFASDTSDPLRLAEAIVHEVGHTQLNRVGDIDRIVDCDDDPPVNYSPWRDDPRPLIGLLHGLYVFCCVARFLRAYTDSFPGSAIDGRRSLTIARLKVARQQVPIGALTPIGRELLMNLTAVIEDEERSMPVSTHVASVVSRHMHAWKDQYPDLRVTNATV